MIFFSDKNPMMSVGYKCRVTKMGSFLKKFLEKMKPSILKTEKKCRLKSEEGSFGTTFNIGYRPVKSPTVNILIIYFKI